MSLTYSSYVTEMQILLKAQNENGAAILNQILPNMIDYAELRIYRDLDLLGTQTVSTITSTPSSRNITIPPGTFVVVEEAVCVTPANTIGDVGTRNPMIPVSKNFLDGACPTNSILVTPQIPKYWYVQTETLSATTRSPGQTVIIGPVPDQAYDIEFTGTMRPATLTNLNPVTFISQYFPDLFIAASMVFGSGYQRDFGAQSDNPKMAMSWEMEYQNHLKMALTEEYRKKAESWSWQHYFPTAQAEPARPQD